MVARLWGTCQGQDVLFSPTEDGRWTCWVPASPTGAYSLQLWAEDLAGTVLPGGDPGHRKPVRL